MGWYDARVLPRIVDLCCGTAATHPLRRRVCAGLHGEVLEVGFGSGHNVPFYPPELVSVAAVEPSDLGWRLAQERVAASPVPVRRVGGDAQLLAMPDASCDSALSTWSLCTIPDPGRALAEVRRVLRPGGTLHFLEHGLAPDEAVRRWQRRLEPLQRRVAGGCHLTRRIVDLVEGAGFTLAEVDIFYDAGAPKVMAADSLGVAVTGLRAG